MPTDLDIIQKTCDLPGLKAARIVVEEAKTFTDPSKALAAFVEFSGEGWLCTANSRSINILPGDEPGRDEYPLHGEAANAARSLHLRQDGGGGWTLTWLREEPAEQDNGLCYETQLAAHNRAYGFLCYQVYHEAVGATTASPDDNLAEYPPVRARFTGFLKTPDH